MNSEMSLMASQTNWFPLIRPAIKPLYSEVQQVHPEKQEIFT